MAITEVAYCSREDVQRSLNLADVPRLNARVDQAIMAGANQVWGLLHRYFYPTTKTILFDQPVGDRLWLYENELAGIPTSVISGNQAMTINTDVFLRPKSGPPYRWLEASYSGTVYWQSQNTPQAAISITGDYGYPCPVLSSTTLAGSLTASATVVQLASSGPGIGSMLLIDSERMILSDKAMVTTGITLAADVNNSKMSTTLTVSGAGINPGELILIDAERMYVENVVGNTLIVDRAVNAATLAAHTNGTAIYAPRQATLLRGQLGTTAATHSNGATVSRLQPPGLIRELNMAYAINNEEGALSGYARSLEQDVATLYKDRGRGVLDLENDAYQTFARKARGRAI